MKQKNIHADPQETICELLEDLELAKIIEMRSDEPEIPVSLDDL